MAIWQPRWVIGLWLFCGASRGAEREQYPTDAFRISSHIDIDALAADWVDPLGDWEPVYEPHIRKVDVCTPLRKSFA
jgi:hypothetical protein